MVVKKSGGVIFGANLTSAEKKAMNIEIQKQLDEFDRKHKREIEAVVLWELRTRFGFGHKRLRDFYDGFDPAIDELIKRYEFDEEDKVWLCTRELKEYGIDLEEWEKEKGGST